MAENKAVNEVDTSPERIKRELEAAALEEGLILSTGSPEKSGSEALNIPEVDRQGAAQKITGLLNYAFVYGFGFLVPAWKVTQDESENLAGAWAKVVAKYTPAKWLDFLPDSEGGVDGCIECDALLVTAAVVVPRINSEPQPETKPETNQNIQKKIIVPDFEPMKATSEIKKENN